MRRLLRIPKSLRPVVGVSAVLLVALATYIYLSIRSDDESFLNNLLVFGLVNINILALLVLIIMVGRNVVKLMFERRRGILGAKLRSRLMGAFVLLASVPMTLSFIVASGLINQATEGWFTTQIESSVASAVMIAKQHLTSLKLAVRSSSERVARELRTKLPTDRAGFASLARTLEEVRQLNDLYAVRIIDSDGTVLVESAHPTATVEPFREPPLNQDAVERALTGTPVVQGVERGASRFLRYYGPLGRFVLSTSYRMDPDYVDAQTTVEEASRGYEQLKESKYPLKTNFFLVLALFNLMAIFAAIWIAFFVSKQITGPIQKLAEGTRNVARGNYDFQLEAVRDDEVGYLVGSFNQMLRELCASQAEAERRGLLIEAVLSNLAVGVITLDNSRRVTAVNSSAGAMLQINHMELPPGVPLGELLRSEDLASVGPLMEALESSDEREGAVVAEVDMRVQCGGRQLMLMCTGGRIVSHAGESLGFVLLFDDITEISRSQHLAAWRDVARRIAHEIKNPLTPIQLSAQRLERLLESSESNSAVAECTKTIVEHVALIKRLANEFSEYGRMPTAQYAPSDLLALVSHTVNTFRSDNPDVKFALSAEGKVPEMLLDPEQIRGVVINVLNNAVAAVRSQSGAEGPLVSVLVAFDRMTSRATIEISDNGPGVPAADKNRIFEPYFTTKKGGTGLGLAIVSSVISDHQGEVRIFDNPPSGTKFVVSLPQHPHSSTARRLAT
jgi:two-component system nitrogen regulation sensor histidine kinase NtrY